MKSEKIKKWKQLAATLKTIKKQEFDLRKEIASEILKGAIGTVNATVDGYKVKAQQSQRQKIDNEALLSIWPNLTEAEKEAVKWLPEIIVSKYKAINQANRVALDSVITTVPNAPTLKVEIIK